MLRGQEQRLLTAVRQAQADVLRALEYITRADPAGLREARAILERTGDTLAPASAAMAQAPRPSPALAGELAALRGRLGRAAALLESGAAYHCAWARRAASLTAGYNRAGAAAGLPRQRVFSVEA